MYDIDIIQYKEYPYCPKCGSRDLWFGAAQHYITDFTHRVNGKCRQCHTEFTEVYSLTGLVGDAKPEPQP